MLDKQLDTLLAHARAAGMPDLCDLPIPAARGLYTQLTSGTGAAPEGVAVRERPAAAGVPRLRLYTPLADGVLPVVVWYHGGGYVLGSLDDYDTLCRQLSVQAQALVVAVDYRLAPEHAYPAAFDDAWAALQWLTSEAGLAWLGAGADIKRLALAGDSAGAVLAAATCLQARDHGGPAITFQALAYPPAAGGYDGDFASRTSFAAGPTLTLRTMDWFNRLCFGDAGRAADTRGAPLHAASLAGLPPALVQLASHDALRDEALAFAQRLRAEGNTLTLVEFLGLAHGYLGQGGLVHAAGVAQRQLGRSLHDALHVAAGAVGG